LALAACFLRKYETSSRRRILAFLFSLSAATCFNRPLQYPCQLIQDLNDYNQGSQIKRGGSELEEERSLLECEGRKGEREIVREEEEG